MSVYNTLMGSAGGVRFASPYVASRRRTMMFIGDSITWGYGVSQWQAYPALLQTRFDTQSSPTGSTDKWVARNVHADDIVVLRGDGVAFKLIERSGFGSSITYDTAGPFSSPTFATNVIDPPNGRTAILFNSVEDSFFVTPTSATVFITLMVKVTGSAGSSITIGVQDGTATINLVEQNVPPIGAMSPTVTTSFGTGVYRLIFAQSGATTPTSTFLVRCTAAGGATARILTVNPTNSYPSSNYIGVQINARGSYAPEDYSDDVGSILETIIHPAAENGNPNTHPIFVLALGTVSIYSNTTGSGDRRRSPSTFQTNLNALVTNLKAAAPNSPIVLTNPPIPGDLATWTTTSPRADYDAAIANVAATHNLFTVDLRNTVASNQYLDGIHPNANGHIALANKYIADLLI